MEVLKNPNPAFPCPRCRDGARNEHAKSVGMISAPDLPPVQVKATSYLSPYLDVFSSTPLASLAHRCFLGCSINKPCAPESLSLTLLLDTSPKEDRTVFLIVMQGNCNLLL